MARIAGVLLPSDKRLDIALTYIYGIGPTLARKILTNTKIPSELRVNQLSPTQEREIAEYIDKNFEVEGNLRQKIIQEIRRLKDISSFRGLRHIKNLPVRGQRTRTNARTKRGKKVTVGSGRKKATEKT